MKNVSIDIKSMVIGFLIAALLLVLLGAANSLSPEKNKYKLSAYGEQYTSGCYILDTETKTLYHTYKTGNPIERIGRIPD